MYYMSAQGVDEHMINAHYYYYYLQCGARTVATELRSCVKVEVDVLGSRP